MKKLIIALGMGILLANDGFAQIEVKIREETRPNSKGSFNALVIDLPGTKRKEVENAWEDFVKDYKGKTKHDKKTSEFMSDECTIKDMSSDKVDIFAKFVENSTGTEMMVWFDLGADNFVASSKDQNRYNAGNVIVQKFASTVSASMIEEELKAQQKKLKEQEDALKKLEKDKAGREKDIVEYKDNIRKQEENIVKAETDIKTNLTGQDKQKSEIDAQKKIIDEINARLKKVKGK